MIVIKETEIGGRTLSLETGRVAKQADGACWARYGDTVVFAAAVGEKQSDVQRDFLPLSVEYRERAYAAGKIPGGFFKREGRPSEKEVLSSRLIDRPIRPLFPDWYNSETQVMVTVLSADGHNDPDILGGIAASAALAVSDIPFAKPVATVVVGRINSDFVINPTFEEKRQSDIEIVVSGSEDSIIMVEGEALEISESVLMGVIKFAHEHIKTIVKIIKELTAEAGRPKRLPPEESTDLSPIEAKVSKKAFDEIKKICRIQDKQAREDSYDALRYEVLESFGVDSADYETAVSSILHDMEKAEVRKNILKENLRLDGRSSAIIRPISIELGILPRAHGSALFTRGQTQALAATTLGSRVDEQRIDSLDGDYKKNFMLHYNFPGFSTGEVSKRMGVGRREIGHGSLAERALKAVLPPWSEFPYTLRIVSDILESNGSSSMATVCSGCLSMMDAGVPIRKPVAGIAMGLISEADRYVVLTDILGAEDHLGDMDFKIAGTRDGITAIQMDIKIEGLSQEILSAALEQAKDARLKILDIMTKAIPEPRQYLSPYAPSIIFLKIDPEKIGTVIGPGGRIIRDIQEKTGAAIDIEDDGSLQISSVNQEGGAKAREMILALVEDPEVGKIYEGVVKRITDYGAFVEILPGRDGMLHISNLEHYRVNKVTDILRLGDVVKVKLLALDSQGKMDLSRKALLDNPHGGNDEDEKPRDRRPPGGGFRKSGGRRD
ncbi:MAG: polyribonucleotide nucleotidyltransferase [FCB group bacterium]|nr:polyribonucleotide nucleotidyltransferase [FCB group bacterium]